jgi:hypothetical protein
MTDDVLPLWIARLAGDQETMGRQHGELAAGADGYQRLLTYYPQMPERLLVGDGRAPGQRAMRLLVTAAKEAALARLERDRPAELLARTRAFMTAAGRPARDARFVGVMDLFQNLVGLGSRLELGPFGARARALQLAAAAPACSTVIAWGAATADGAIRHARNFDFPGIGAWDAAPSLVLCAPDRGLRYGFVATRGADVPAVTVFNEAGIAVTSHTRFHREVGLGGAAIIDIVHELGRRAESLADAARIAGERPSASTWGLAVSSERERRGAVIELHAGLARIVEPAAGARWLVCANRYRHPEMTAGEAAASAAWAIHSDQRERRLRALLETAAGPLGSEALMAMLADRSDPDAPELRRHLGGVVAQPCNVHAVVIEPASRSLLLGVGPAPVCDGPFVRVRWDWDGPVGAWELDPEGRLEGVPGLTVEPAEVAGPARSEAAQQAAAAIREEQSSHDPHAIAAALERAITAAPDDPSLRLAAAWTHLRRGDAGRALAHARAGLLRERLPYRRGQLLLWGARAALATRDPEAAAAFWQELDRLWGPDLDELRARSRADRARPRRWRTRRPDAHLFMLDAH